MKSCFAKYIGLLIFLDMHAWVRHAGRRYANHVTGSGMARSALDCLRQCNVVTANCDSVNYCPSSKVCERNVHLLVTDSSQLIVNYQWQWWIPTSMDVGY